jgi:hypothetical protein
MQRIVDLPTVEELIDPKSGHQVLIYSAGSRSIRIFDAESPALALAVLLAPVGEKRHQRMLVLPKANFVRGAPGVSESSSRRNTIAFLRDNGVLQETEGGTHYYLTKSVVFPSVSRASSCVSRTSTNGWREWQVRGSGGLTLESALDEEEIRFYDGRPDDFIDIPFHL